MSFEKTGNGIMRHIIYLLYLKKCFLHIAKTATKMSSRLPDCVLEGKLFAH